MKIINSDASVMLQLANALRHKPKTFVALVLQQLWLILLHCAWRRNQRYRAANPLII